MNDKRIKLIKALTGVTGVLFETLWSIGAGVMAARLVPYAANRGSLHRK
jgi:hypothetical protein